MSQETWVCPFCQTEISTNAKACPHCGSDAETGWSEDTYMDGILPTDISYEESYEEEFGEKKAPVVNWGAVIIVFSLFGVLIASLFIFR